MGGFCKGVGEFVQRFQQGFTQRFQIHGLQRLCIQTVGVSARHGQQLAGQLGGAAHGIAQAVNLIRSQSNSTNISIYAG